MQNYLHVIHRDTFSVVGSMTKSANELSKDLAKISKRHSNRKRTLSQIQLSRYKRLSFVKNLKIPITHV